MKAVWHSGRSDRELCPFVFTTFRRSSAWRTRQVLAKAKELGIAAARVASSSLDKITAEYLEERASQGASRVTRPAAATATRSRAATTARRTDRGRVKRRQPEAGSSPELPPTTNRRPLPATAEAAAADRDPGRRSAAAAAAAPTPAAAARAQARRKGRLHSTAAQAARQDRLKSPEPPNCRPARPGKLSRAEPNSSGAAISAASAARHAPAATGGPGARHAAQAKGQAPSKPAEPPSPQNRSPGRCPGHLHQAAHRRPRTGRAAQAKAVQDHRRPDGIRGLCQRQPGHRRNDRAENLRQIRLPLRGRKTRARRRHGPCPDQEGRAGSWRTSPKTCSRARRS